MPNRATTIDLSGAGNVTASGYNAAGVSVNATGAVTVNGYGSTVITANSTGTAAPSATNLRAGVYANSSAGTVNVNVNQVATTGAFTPGVVVFGDTHEEIAAERGQEPAEILLPHRQIEAQRAADGVERLRRDRAGAR